MVKTFQFESEFFVAYRRLFGDLPSSYFLFDLETTGSDKRNDLIWNIGAMLVEDGRVVEEFDAVLDWTSLPVSEIDPCWLTKKIASINSQLRRADKPQHLTLDLMRTGRAPREVLQELVDKLTQAKKQNIPVVNHGLINFDIPMLTNQTQTWLGAPYLFKRAQVVDTAALEKAIELRLPPSAPEYAGCGLLAYQKKVLDIRSHVRFSLDTHCARKYNLWSKTGLSSELAHLGLNDTKLCDCLIRTYKEL